MIPSSQTEMAENYDEGNVEQTNYVDPQIDMIWENQPQLTEEEKKRIKREKQRVATALRRAQMNEEERKKSREKARERLRMKRANRTAEEHVRDKQKMREAMRRLRALQAANKHENSTLPTIEEIINTIKQEAHTEHIVVGFPANSEDTSTDLIDDNSPSVASTSSAISSELEATNSIKTEPSDSLGLIPAFCLQSDPLLELKCEAEKFAELDPALSIHSEPTHSIKTELLPQSSVSLFGDYDEYVGFNNTWGGSNVDSCHQRNSRGRSAAALERDRERMRRKRSERSREAYEREKERNRLKAAERRAKMSTEKYLEEKRRDRERMRKMRAQRSKEQHELDKLKVRETMRRLRSHESSDLRQQRLVKVRETMRRTRANESPEARDKRLERLRLNAQRRYSMSNLTSENYMSENGVETLTENLSQDPSEVLESPSLAMTLNDLIQDSSTADQ